MKRLGPLFVAGVITLVVLAAGATVGAQQKGQYLPGTCGLNSGIQAGPGFTYSNLFTFEYGIGKMLPVGKQLLQLGLIGYGQWQVSDNGGGVLANTRGRYGVAALGPEVTLIVPRHKLSLTFRYEPELYAASRIQGSTFVFSGALSF